MDNLDNSLQNLTTNILHNSISEYLHFTQHYTNIKKIKILQINMRSIRNLEKFDILKQLIDEIKQVDLVIVSETWLNKDHFEFYEISGFKGFFSGRNMGQSGGGLTIYVKSEIEVELISKFDESFNSIWIKLNTIEPMYIAGYYRPRWTNIDDYFLHLESFLTTYNSNN